MYHIYCKVTTMQLCGFCTVLDFVQVWVRYLMPNPKKNMVVWDPMPELTITSPYVYSRVDSNTFALDNHMPESTLPAQIWERKHTVIYV
jgi:hypothetical protein